MTWPALLAALTLGLWLAGAVELLRGRRHLLAIATVPPLPAATGPRVSVVIAARDEAPHIRAAMQTVLALEYPALEIIAVNDRSSDGTGAVLEALAVTDARLKVVHVTALPPGWLGKNHALHAAAQAARGEYVLFTDADVHLAPDVLGRAVALMEQQGLDHLVVGPKATGGTGLMRVLLATFALSFSLSTRPWRAADPDREEHCGIGAFNLVRASALAAIGGLATIRLRPDDDIKLGKQLKSHGFRQRFVEGGDAVTVEWYPGAWAMVRGLEKNSFPFLDYSVTKTLGFCALFALVALWPFAALFVVAGPAWWLNLAVVAVMLALTAGVARVTLGLPAWYALGMPLGVMLMLVTVLNSMLRTLAQGGVVWRGTLYPLAELKTNRV